MPHKSSNKGFRILFKDESHIYRFGIIISDNQTNYVVKSDECHYNLKPEQIIYKLYKCQTCKWSDDNNLISKCYKCQQHLYHDILKLWKEDWQRFTFRRVSRVILDPKNRFNISYEYHPQDAIWETIKEVESIDEIPVEWRFSAKESYNDYFGFTSSRCMCCLKKSDVCQGQEIYFNAKQYSCIDLDVSISGSFSKCGNHTCGFTPPEISDIICGIVKYRPDGRPFYESWFISSPQFYRLWLIVTGNMDISHEKYLNTLKTGAWMDLYDIKNISYQERLEYLKLKPKRTESYAINWTDIYVGLGYFHSGQIDLISKLHLPINFINRFITNIFCRVTDRKLNNHSH